MTTEDNAVAPIPAVDWEKVSIASLGLKEQWILQNLIQRLKVITVGNLMKLTWLDLMLSLTFRECREIAEVLFQKGLSLAEEKDPLQKILTLTDGHFLDEVRREIRAEEKARVERKEKKLESQKELPKELLNKSETLRPKDLLNDPAKFIQFWSQEAVELLSMHNPQCPSIEAGADLQGTMGLLYHFNISLKRIPRE